MTTAIKQKKTVFP